MMDFGMLPRLAELRDWAASEQVAMSYFDGLEEAVGESGIAVKSYIQLEAELQQLDQSAWLALKRKAQRCIGHVHDTRGWNQLFAVLNEAKGYRLLREIGCHSIAFVDESKKKTPDLVAWEGLDRVHLEVKTIEESDEAIRKKIVFGSDELTFRNVEPLGLGWEQKLAKTLAQADQQLGDAPRRITYLALHIDPPWHSRYEQTMSLIEQVRPSSMEVVVEIRGLRSSLIPRTVVPPIVVSKVRSID
jgi:hypothetical protein